VNKKICIVSQSHLCRNPRVLKESITLSKAGYIVCILTAIYSDELLTEDLFLLKGTNVRYEFYSDNRRPNFRSFISRLKRKIWIGLQKYFSIESKYSLGYNINNLKKTCVIHSADLYIMHQELATVVGSELIDEYPIAFDIEDWYSEDLLPDVQKHRPKSILKRAERIALQKGVFCTTTSNAMASGLRKHYQLKNDISIIYNSFNSIQQISYNVDNRDLIRLYWFSQTIGTGRGLEFFISCLAKTNKSWVLNLRGNISADYYEILKKIVSAKDKLVIMPLKKNNEILDDMKNYDIGLALEPSHPPNKNLTISNKLFHYMAGGLPVIASNTLGQQEIANMHKGIIFLYKNNDQESLVNLLNSLGDTIKKKLPQIKENVNKAYENYHWQAESKKIMYLVDKALKDIG
jgi:glycosyltransferase involved in cell wall biosynthesis